MKFFHISDLHIGKRLYDMPLYNDQKYILEKIVSIAEQVEPDGILICGDIYDKQSPGPDAIELFDRFLTAVSDVGIPVYAISGNHDCARRVSFGADIMKKGYVYFAPPFNGEVSYVDTEDEYGPLRIWLLPFLRMAQIKAFFPENNIESCNDAFRVLLQSLTIDDKIRNVLLCHQFLTGAATCRSEEIFAGGLDNIDASLFDRFDYIALGHIHSPQSAGKPEIRYCGSPLKYSFSEAAQTKLLTVVELRQKGEVLIDTLDLKPLHELHELKGSFDDLMKNETAGEDYFHITLTDEEDIVEGLFRLRTVYPNLLKLDYDNTRTRNTELISECENISEIPMPDMFCEFFELINNAPPSKLQKNYIENIFKETK